jgi:hypothetical protein
MNDLVFVEPALVVEVRSLTSGAGRRLREPVFSRVVGPRALGAPRGVEEPGHQSLQLTPAVRRSAPVTPMLVG